ncbi:hypothetical protein I5E68_14185 [Novosphingobium sp. YJ-S2-02]|uniref:Uncharacterized protein n=1 Tax=Novosphingobium aureum TaxID=2792964 RepID=A0A931HDH0_9SPHN|nr:hypothetical protein [Novosphingobium aureum]MBH0114090.1 hypothetical protein [Novosphingobium aureum]
MNFWKKTIVAGTLAATAAVSATPAMARDYHRGNDNTAAIAIGAGVIGLALGAIIASDKNDNDRYRDRRYVSNSDWRYRDGYYWDRDGRRYSRDAYERRSRYDRDDRYYDRRRGYDRDRGDYRRGY